jgi:hypothetical protein
MMNQNETQTKAKATLITISRKNHTISVEPEWPILSYYGRDNVIWICDGSFHFDVSFPTNKTPFSKARFTHDCAESGDIQFLPVENSAEVFKYTVYVPGAEPLDPGLIVKR